MKFKEAENTTRKIGYQECGGFLEFDMPEIHKVFQ